ncbi:MAG: ATP-dependent RNA helicase RhlB [Gammaproteobacteria bacterium]|nr:ATP-dependent RNA helicase RhlB [Gammaproteobacteria bacterium]
MTAPASKKHLTEVAFSGLGLPAPLMQGIEEIGFSFCTPIQAETLPLALAGHDVAGQAQTGTGKTAAFLLALMNHLLKHPAEPGRKANQPRALVLAPTRELAIQIHKDAVILGGHAGLSLGLVYGGTGYDTQRAMMEAGVDILIGTPGRVIDYFKQHVFDLKAAQVMVLDEADRMFDLGFIKDVRFLLRRLPPPERRLNMLFSATLSWRVTELAYEHMNSPRLIEVEPDKVTADKVTQAVYHVANEEKIALLIGLLRRTDATRSIVFVNTKAAAHRVLGYLTGNGFGTALLSGDVPQKKRQQLLAEFQAGKLAILVATDVAARGLHIPEVSHVFNYDLPQSGEDYVHRIGRTARVGASGDSISFACEEYAFTLPEIEDYTGHKIPVMRVTDELLAKPLLPPHKSEFAPKPFTARQGKAGGRAPGGRGAPPKSHSHGSSRSRGRG